MLWNRRILLMTNYNYQIRIKGIVQGIGFRPFVYRLAKSLDICGWINNDTEGVNIVIESDESTYQCFISQIKKDKPKLALIESIIVSRKIIEKKIFIDFEIHKSASGQYYEAEVLPDLSTCTDCINEIKDPKDRRFQYFFTNCTNCGPRFSIISNLPYDRKNTSMTEFQLCENCLVEYENPMDRRFHAQPNACPKCGPIISLYSQDRTVMEQGFMALEKAVLALKSGAILALKGIGGYQLVVDAENENSLKLLRNRKNRKRKPFALMIRSVEEVKLFCEVNQNEALELQSPAAPIVILRKKKKGKCVAALVAPNNPYLGVMLPNSPLHFWLLRLFEGPLVMTSANLSDEPLVFKDEEVFDRLAGLTDFYLTHNRPILRPIDDSIVQFVEGRMFLLRLARGYAPLSIKVKDNLSNQLPLLATGAHMKNIFAFYNSKKIFVSQHIGDLESELSQDLFKSEVHQFINFYHLKPNILIHDSHPEYFTTDWAKINQFILNAKLDSIQHHRAHIFAAFAENEINGNYLGVSWDGTGYGDDGTIWGSEFLIGNAKKNKLDPIASLRSFKLLGGSAAIHSPWKVTLSMLFEIDFELARLWFFKFYNEATDEAFEILKKMWQTSLNSPLTTSMGRFLEGISALIGISMENEYEADSAIQLEFAALSSMNSKHDSDSNLTVSNLWCEENEKYLWDWRVWVKDVAEKMIKQKNGFKTDNCFLSLQIHNLLVDAIFEMAKITHQHQIVIGGGVFQNRIIMGLLLKRSKTLGISVITPSRVPLNDGGIAIGQIYSHLLNYEVNSQRIEID